MKTVYILVREFEVACVSILYCHSEDDVII